MQMEPPKNMPLISDQEWQKTKKMYEVLRVVYPGFLTKAARELGISRQYVYMLLNDDKYKVSSDVSYELWQYIRRWYTTDDFVMKLLKTVELVNGGEEVELRYAKKRVIEKVALLLTVPHEIKKSGHLSWKISPTTTE